MKSLNLSNKMQVPCLDKIVVNIGLGEALDNAQRPWMPLWAI